MRHNLLLSARRNPSLFLYNKDFVLKLHKAKEIGIQCRVFFFNVSLGRRAPWKALFNFKIRILFNTALLAQAFTLREE